MFIHDEPIESENDDFLGRTRFSNHLAEALINWKEKESLVIALYGKWGSGKSSVINLAIENIKKKEKKPTVIEFNPWFFSNESNLTAYFFNEITKELEIKNDDERDKKIAGKLKLYASLINLVPVETVSKKPLSKILLILSVTGIISSKSIELFEIPNNWISNVLLFGGVVLILLAILKNFLLKLGNYFQTKSDDSKKSALDVKKEIQNELRNREKTLVVVIDDIDRLNQIEIRQIFRLIKVNADFQNTIYLLAFDKKIVAENLKEQDGISGEEYLKKIVQVSFDIPFVNSDKISNFLFQKLNLILETLPPSAVKYFGKDNAHWENIYHSGFGSFFKNIRDVKRFINSLEFNISQMHQNGVMEVNPVDFIAIEAIRVFAHDFYLLMRKEKKLFTSTGYSSKDNREKILNNLLDCLTDKNKESVQELVERLFPQMYISIHYGNDWEAELRVCAHKHFDSYFTLIPGGDEEELSQFELKTILSKTISKRDFEKIIREYLKKDKLLKVLQRMQDCIEDFSSISQKNIIQVLFDIADDLPEQKLGLYSIITIDRLLERVIYQLLERESDKNKNYKIIKQAILQSKSLFGPCQTVRFFVFRQNKKENSVILRDKIKKLQELCLKRIKNTNKDILLNHNNFTFILYCWKEWDKEKKWEKFVEEITKDNKKMIQFVDKFVTEQQSQTLTDYAIKTTKIFNYKSLNNFCNLEEIKIKLEKIKISKNKLYKNNKDTIDFYLDNFEDRNKNEF